MPGFSLHDLTYSLVAFARDQPNVTASTMAVFLGLLALSGTIMLVRDLILYQRAAEAR